ncbi:cyclin-dependent kinase regulatory subunit [Trichinella spiralis]|uniref:cyclin-dependent kinase regulatory subunit n=1 Tax=Trichinella spiralis TaxID=6334 RepID=UPI0001EFC7AA|nr:cyclin-dependent kinase regulatory subunit [Trichinella spiralis]
MCRNGLPLFLLFGKNSILNVISNIGRRETATEQQQQQQQQQQHSYRQQHQSVFFSHLHATFLDFVVVVLSARRQFACIYLSASSPHPHSTLANSKISKNSPFDNNIKITKHRRMFFCVAANNELTLPASVCLQTIAHNCA